MRDKKIEDKETQELKKIRNHYLDKRKEIMKNTSFKVEVFLEILFQKNLFHQNKSRN